MSNAAEDTERREREDRRRQRRIQNVKTGGDLVMYVGSAGLMMPLIQKAKQNQNGIMGLCATGAGAVLSIGLGNIASRILNKTIDKVVDLWDDIKPGNQEKNSTESPAKEEAENG